jgi:CubicO group peptidase (beta-lactamase class C family)
MKAFVKPTLLAMFIVGLLIWVPRALGQGDAKPSTPLQTNVEAAQVIARLEKHVPELMKAADVPGVAIALVRDGEVVWHHGFGVKNSKTNELVDDTTVFEAASLSKPVFAYAVLKLVDAGKIDLDKPLNEYLPGNYDVDDARLGQITARRVLSHTTGFPNWRLGGKLKIYFNPGERFSYSGEGMVYLSKVIEHITGEPFNAFMKRTVFVPLSMTSSSYVWEDRYDKLKTFRHNKRGVATGQNKPTGGPAKNTPNAAASLRTTAQDYGRFVVAMLKGTGLKPETRKLMLTPQVQVGEGGSQNVGRPKPKPFPDVAWGLGWGLQATKDGLSFWHWGDNGDSKAYVVVFDQPKLGVVYFANGSNGLSIVREILADAVGGAQPALNWLNYEQHDSPRNALFKQILARGGSAALSDYRDRLREKPGSPALNEANMNDLGYDLLALKRVEDALVVFKQIVADYPSSANAYDSLAEAYEVQGNKSAAIENYKRSLELNPKNENAAEHLKKLESDGGKGGGK